MSAMSMLRRCTRSTSWTTTSVSSPFSSETENAAPPFLRSAGSTVLHRPLDVLRVVIDATDDHELLDAPGDIELSSVIEKGEVAGPQPAGRIAVDLRRKGLACGNLVSPIAFRDMRTADPDLADLVDTQPIKVFGIDDGDSFAYDRAPAADEDLRIRLFGRRTHATVANFLTG